MLYEVNLGIRDYFTYKTAMLNNSLFSAYLQENGLNVYKGKNDKIHSKNESTRDIVCLDFDFGSNSYDEELSRFTKLDTCSLPKDKKNQIESIISKIKSQKELYSKKSREKIREQFYNEGVDITYTYKIRKANGMVQKQQTIHYTMLFRTSAKAKLGQAIFINSKLYDKAYNWMTMGLGNKMPANNAKIVELSAYAPLTTSTIIDVLNIPVEDVLILKDQDSFFKTSVNIVKAETYLDKKGNTKKKCIVQETETEVKNTIWDGMGIIESNIFPEQTNGMLLLRNHFFKMCGVRGNIQMFFRDWCKKNDLDYETHQVQDMFGKWHYLKDIKIITTDNAVKWIKFVDLMGGTLESAYLYWCNCIQSDGNVWGIVKTDHPSKLGKYQQLSYQMINTLPCTKEDIKEIAQTSINYTELLKRDNSEFEKFLRKNQNEINHYEMLADLYKHNHDFGNCKWFREEKKKIISNYVSHLRKGKILVNGDNLTVFGNPYALLLYSVGEDWRNDHTLNKENGCIQCYTSRFADNEYLAAFRNPHNSPNNICYMHNVYSDELRKYFKFSQNIVAINCIGTDIQDRANGMDEDSDFMLFTNHPAIVKCAKICYREYPTVVNALKESGITYNNTKTDYAAMDNKFASSKIDIGWSSNLAQLAMTYYWTEKLKKQPDKKRLKELYDNFIILSVLAQVIIDGCKREYEISGEDEIKRISQLPSMTMFKETDKITGTGKPKTIRCDFPKFMQYTREIKYTVDGKEIPFEEIYEKKLKLKNRINYELECPMNWLEEYLDKIQGASTSNTIPTKKFFIKMHGNNVNRRQICKVQCLIINYDNKIKALKCNNIDNDCEYIRKLKEYSADILNELSKIKISNHVTMNRLIETALGLEKNNNQKYYKDYESKYTRKTLNCLYKMNKETFLSNFV